MFRLPERSSELKSMFCTSKISLSTPFSHVVLPTIYSKAVHLVQSFVHASVVSYVAFVYLRSSSLLLSVPREGCVS